MVPLSRGIVNVVSTLLGAVIRKCAILKLPFTNLSPVSPSKPMKTSIDVG